MTRSAAILSVLICVTPAVAADGPSDQVPELKLLDQYAGTWDFEVTTRGLPFTKGTATATWVLDGRFLQQTGELQAADGSPVAKITTLMTYDPGKKVYRSWTFGSDGSTVEAEGTWDAAGKVLTTVSRKDAAGGYSTTTADFSTPGVETWKIVFTDATGKAVREIAGKNTRRKK